MKFWMKLDKGKRLNRISPFVTYIFLHSC